MTVPVISYTRCPSVPTVSAIAHARGLLEEEFRDERDVRFVFKSVGFSPQIVYGHDERFWIRNAGHAPAVWKRSQGVDCKVVGLAFLDGRYPVLSLNRSGIDRVEGLRGRRLAVFHNPDSPFDLMVAQQLKIYRVALQQAGLTLEDVELVYVPRRFSPGAAKGGFLRFAFQTALEALESGAVDAVTASIPPDGGLYPLLNVLYDTRLAPDLTARVHPSVLRGLVVSTPLLEERRDLVVRVVARLIEASDWAASAPIAAVRALSADLHQEPESLTAVYENIPQGIRLSLDDAYVETLAVQKAFLREQGLIERDFDLEGWLDRGLLAEAAALHRARHAVTQPVGAGA